MTAVQITPARSAPRVAAIRVTFARVLRSELTKFRSVRSTMWTLLIAFVLTIGLGALFSAVNANQYATFSRQDRASFDPIAVSLSGISFAQLAIGVLGVLVISGEYSTGMIRASLTVVPSRLPILWGKLVVFALGVFTVSLVATFASFLIGQGILAGHGLGVSITAPSALRSVIGAALYVTVAGMVGLALGALMRNTAAGISTFVAAFFVIPPLTQLLPSSVGAHLVQYLPSNAGAALYGGTRGVDNPLSPWTGLTVLCLYAVTMVGAAAWRLKRADA